MSALDTKEIHGCNHDFGYRVFTETTPGWEPTWLLAFALTRYPVELQNSMTDSPQDPKEHQIWL